MKPYLACLLLAFAAPVLAQTAATPAEPLRPAADSARDAARKPFEMVEFAKVLPAQKVVDFIAGSGYFTRVFSLATGPTGQVIAVVPPASAKLNPADAKAMDALAVDPRYGNIKVVPDLMQAGAPGTIDMVWTAQNYHDLYNFLPPEQLLAFNKGVFALLKPGGYFVIVDNAAAAGSGTSATNSLHRTDPEQVKKDLKAAGFVLDGETGILANPADDLTKIVFDPAIRGQSSQFAYRFKKP